MTREEHLAWCKQRALEYIDRGQINEGLTSMMSDMSKHPETAAPALDQLTVGLFGYHTEDGLTDDTWANPDPVPPFATL